MGMRVGAILIAFCTLTVFAHGCRCCDSEALQNFDSKPVQGQIAAYSRAVETHCFLEGSAGGFLDAIASHGQASVEAVVPYLDRNDGGFRRVDAVIVLHDAALKGTDIAVAVPKLKIIANRGSEFERAVARLALHANGTRPRASHGASNLSRTQASPER